MAAFVERHGLGHVRHVADLDGRVWSAFAIPSQPAWVFVDGDTGEHTTTFGALDDEELTAAVSALEG